MANPGEGASGHGGFSKARPRFAGGKDAIAAALHPHVTCISWLQYSENVTHGKLGTLTILKHKALVRSLAELAPNLAFRKCDLQHAARAVREVKSDSWPTRLLPSEEEEWGQAMARRLMCMLRHIAQGRRAGRAWLSFLDEAAQASPTHVTNVALATCSTTMAATAAGASTAAAATAPTPKFYGYDEEHKKAWRQVEGGQREFAVSVTAPEESKGTDPALATWLDGEVRLMPQLTVDDLLHVTALAQKRPSSKRGDCWWTGTQLATGLYMRISNKAERHRKISIVKVGNNQLVMVKTSLFSSEAAAAQFLVPIAEKYSKGEITKEEVYPLRDSMLQEYQAGASGLAGRAELPHKRRAVTAVEGVAGRLAGRLKTKPAASCAAADAGPEAGSDAPGHVALPALAGTLFCGRSGAEFRIGQPVGDRKTVHTGSCILVLACIPVLACILVLAGSIDAGFTRSLMQASHVSSLLCLLDV